MNRLILLLAVIECSGLSGFPISTQPAAAIGSGKTINEELLSAGLRPLLIYDDWGIKGAPDNYGIAPFAFRLSTNGLLDSDPLYSNLPVTWIINRKDVICPEADCEHLAIEAAAFDTAVSLSSDFGYLRGDWGFLDFSLQLEGTTAKTGSWRLQAENLGYDGQYGYYGPQRSRVGESISQVYRLDMQRQLTNWTILPAVRYRKANLGIVRPASFFIDSQTGETVPSLIYGGRQKTTNLQAGLVARQITRHGDVAFGFQLDGYQYRNSPASAATYLEGEALQQQAFGTIPLEVMRIGLRIEGQMIRRVVHLRYQPALIRERFSGIVHWPLSGANRWQLAVGIRNNGLFADLRCNHQLSPRWQIDLRFKNESLDYPLIYYTVPDRQTDLTARSFVHQRASVGIAFQSHSFQSVLRAQAIHSNQLWPMMSGYPDTLLAFKPLSGLPLYLEHLFCWTTGWQTRILGYSRFGLNPGQNYWPMFSGAVQATQAIELFDGNLLGYFTGQLLYSFGARHQIWLEELRSIVYSDEIYYTGQRLDLSFRVGCRIGDLHLFYAVYNPENRPFTTIGLMPVRHILTLLGIEWSFLD